MAYEDCEAIKRTIMALNPTGWNISNVFSAVKKEHPQLTEEQFGAAVVELVSENPLVTWQQYAAHPLTVHPAAYNMDLYNLDNQTILTRSGPIGGFTRNPYETDGDE